MTEQRFLTRQDGNRLAYNRVEASNPAGAPGVIFLGGLMSDKEGSKALALERWAQQQGRAFVRFDYFGHGQSSGDFVQSTIGRWRDDAVAVLEQLSDGPQVLVGSSMGGWIALLLALAQPERVAGLIGIAAAPDFTTRLMWPSLEPGLQQLMQEKGVADVPSDYGAPYPIAMQLIEESRQHLLLDDRIALACPVHLLQGQQDQDVPWRHALALLDALDAPSARLTLIKEGDHRLSRDPDIALLLESVQRFA